jgi:enterochelin esterase-like enzyme
MVRFYTARCASFVALGWLGCSAADEPAGQGQRGGSGGAAVDGAIHEDANIAGSDGATLSRESGPEDANTADGREGSSAEARGPADADGPADSSTDSGFSVGDPGTVGDGDFTAGPTFPTQPDLTDKGAPKGKSFHFTMDSTMSAIFKGDDAVLLAANQHAFTRGVDVYVPAKYVDGTPAPVLVIQDGPGELSLVKNALDNLTISTDPMRKLPAFIAVAVANGGGDGRGSERGLEYDTMSDRYARFIHTEVLPAVVANAQIKAAYPKIAITDNPEGRATLGCSSGGAAALTMAWFRPDLFRRVMGYSATLLNIQNATAPEAAMYPQGAAEYHSDLQLIAKTTPAKPVRVFLNANDNETQLSGEQKAASALKAMNYHYRFVRGIGASHCQYDVRSATLADTLVWSWRGYPTP